MTDLRLPTPDGIEILDVELFGAPELSCSYLVHAAEPALIETGPATVFETRQRASSIARNVEPKHIVLSHIHLDHAGGVGHVAELYPGRDDLGPRHRRPPHRRSDATRRERAPAVRRRARHDVRRTRCRSPSSGSRVMEEGTRIPLGDRDMHVLYTPGHASHEVTLYDDDSGTAFVGDTAGVCYGEGWQKPATPPPEFDLDAALDSIARVQKLKPTPICFTHYGPTHESALEEAAKDLREWDDLLRPLVLRGADEEELLAAIDPVVGAPPGNEEFAHAATELSSTRNSLLGYLRYYQKRVLEPKTEA